MKAAAIEAKHATHLFLFAGGCPNFHPEVRCPTVLLLFGLCRSSGVQKDVNIEGIQNYSITNSGCFYFLQNSPFRSGCLHSGRPLAVHLLGAWVYNSPIDTINSKIQLKR